MLTKEVKANFTNIKRGVSDFQKFSQIFCTEERADFAILSDYKGQSYIVAHQSEEAFTIKVNGMEIPEIFGISGFERDKT